MILKGSGTETIQSISHFRRDNNYQTPFLYSCIPMRSPRQLISTPTSHIEDRFQVETQLQLQRRAHCSDSAYIPTRVPSQTAFSLKDTSAEIKSTTEYSLNLTNHQHYDANLDDIAPRMTVPSQCSKSSVLINYLLSLAKVSSRT